MKKALFILSIIIFIIAIKGNFDVMLMGRTVTKWNILITVCFVIFWSIFLICAKKTDSLLKYSLTLGILTSLTAIIGLVINIFDLSLTIIIIPIFIFLTPLYGMKIFFNNNIAFIIAMIIISILWSFLSFILVRRTKPK
ncbi:MAG: hypothetical protein VB095_00785 [Anaerovorax sp.]|nr:hypothetical protein [Anaerovorax sp.]